MGIKDYLKNKKTKKEEPDILDTLTSTMEQLQRYLDKLNNGEAHYEYREGTKNRKCQENFIRDEKDVISETLKQLGITKETIKTGRIVEEHFHYDIDGRDMGEDCDC